MLSILKHNFGNIPLPINLYPTIGLYCGTTRGTRVQTNFSADEFEFNVEGMLKIGCITGKS